MGRVEWRFADLLGRPSRGSAKDPAADCAPVVSRVGLRTKIIGFLTLVLLVICVAYIVFTYFGQKERTTAELLETSRVLVLEMDAVWDFVSINQNAINYTSDGVYDYKSLHCAIAGKSVATLFSDRSDYLIRFTNLNPRNPYNAPDEYEERALKDFSENPQVTERYGYETMDGEPVFRYVSSMEVAQSCLECHGGPAGELDVTGYQKEGWSEGDIAGAVSVVVPTEIADASMRASVFSNVLFFVFLMLGLALLIYAVLGFLITSPLMRLSSSLSRMGGTGAGSFEPLLGEAGPEGGNRVASVSAYAASKEIDSLFVQFDSMAGRLSDLYSNLEFQVVERTDQLSRANEELKLQRQRVERINARLARDNRYKSDFLAIVSHEFRTPLTSILAFTEMIIDNVPESDTETLSQLEEIRKSGAILLEMVDNVLETARIQAGSERLNLELVDVSDVVGMVAAAQSAVAARKGVSLSTSVQADVPLLMSDWEKVRRILTNLTSNAVKFTPSGGRVNVEVSAGEAGKTVTIRVIDTGIGIPKDKQRLVFERFTQENMSTVRRYGGSGLGLSLVNDLVSMLGGEVSVESEPGEGSIFTVVLPVDSTDASREGSGCGQDNAD